MRIILETVSLEKQRLGTVGDWCFDENGDLIVQVCDLGDWRYTFLFMRHEMDEAMLCKYNNITTEMVDEDQKKARDTDDPDSFSGYPGACVQESHNSALSFEWLMAKLLNVSWGDYGEAIFKIKPDFHG